MRSVYESVFARAEHLVPRATAERQVKERFGSEMNQGVTTTVVVVSTGAAVVVTTPPEGMTTFCPA
jgi:hypothetical protein